MFKWNLVQAKSIMTKRMITIWASASIYDAMHLMIENKISGLPVVDEDMHLLGIVTEKDIMELLFLDQKGQDKTVADCMTQTVLSFRPEDSVVNICSCFIRNPIRRVPIIENGKLVGVVARRDILSIMFASREEEGEQK